MNDQQESKKKSVIGSFLVNLSKVLPKSLIGALGGPLVAGGVVAVAGGLIVGVPTAYLGIQSMKPASGIHRSSKESAFAKMFGGSKSLTESMLPEEAMRAANLENEQPRSDEESSLGLLIPEELPGAKEKEDKSDSKDKPSALTYGGKKLNPEDLAKWKDRIGSSGSGLANTPGGGGSGPGVTAGGTQSQGAFASAGAGSAVGGKSGKSQKTAIKTFGGRMQAQQTGALAGAKRAANLSQRAYTTDQLAAGYSGAAFGEAGRPASIVSNPNVATVGGVDAGMEGPPTQDVQAPPMSSGHGEVPSLPGGESGSLLSPELRKFLLLLGVFVLVGALVYAMSGIQNAAGRLALLVVGLAALTYAVSRWIFGADWTGPGTVDGLMGMGTGGQIMAWIGLGLAGFLAGSLAYTAYTGALPFGLSDTLSKVSSAAGGGPNTGPRVSTNTSTVTETTTTNPDGSTVLHRTADTTVSAPPPTPPATPPAGGAH